MYDKIYAYKFVIAFFDYYKCEIIIIFYALAKIKRERNKFMKIRSKLLIGTTMLVTICGCVFAATFSDINEEHWAYSYVSDLTTANVISGYPDGTFKPEGTISRAEFLKLLIQASLPKGISIDGAPSAGELPEHWATKYVGAANRYRIVEPGSITIENVDQPITRIEMALMIAKADVNMRYNTIDASKSVTFNDYDEMTAEQLRYLTHSVSKGLITGYPDNTFKPENNMTRAEAATMIYRYLNGGDSK